MVQCPVCSKEIPLPSINKHLDSNCTTDTQPTDPPKQVARIFQTPSSKRSLPPQQSTPPKRTTNVTIPHKRPFPGGGNSSQDSTTTTSPPRQPPSPPPKKQKPSSHLRSAMPLAEKMRPTTLEDICGQELVGPNGILRGLIEEGRVPSMILWGAAGCGKTTIARVIAGQGGCRFVEISATASGVAECKKIFAEARSELGLTGRRTILFCDEIHRFTKSQQDVFLAPVESGQIILIGATTENPSFKVQSALLSRCRTFTLNKLSQPDIESILHRALKSESPTDDSGDPIISPLLDNEMITYLARFADGDARTGLNLLELSMNLSQRATTTKESIKASLTHTLVYDRSGDKHYDTISAFHKSIRGSSPDAALFWLSRMLASGEDPLFIARRMVVMASEDIGVADNSMLLLATATMTAVQQVGLPEARINLAHCAVALAEARKSVRIYRGLTKAMEFVESEDGAGEVPVHLRNGVTGLMKGLGYGKEYKYNPDFKAGRVKQEYLPEEVRGVSFLEDMHLGLKVDSDLEEDEEMEGKEEEEGYSCEL